MPLWFTGQPSRRSNQMPAVQPVTRIEYISADSIRHGLSLETAPAITHVMPLQSHSYSYNGDDSVTAGAAHHRSRKLRPWRALVRATVRHADTSACFPTDSPG